MVRCLLSLLMPLMLLISGCSVNGGRVQLFNYDFGSMFGNTPDTITVKKGDTLYSIARRYNVGIREIVETNRLAPPYNLYVGRVLRLPHARYHVVAKGDTMYNISKKYNVDMSSLSRVNQLEEPYALRIGQRLVLPGSVFDRSNSTTTATNTYTPRPQAQTSSQSSGFSFWGDNSKSASETAPKAATAIPTKYRKEKFMWPVKGTVISNYGAIGKGRTNDGINIKAPLGTTVKCADVGTVAYAGNELKGFGNLILIKHQDGWVTAYAHNDKVLVKKGQKIRKGEKIATVGSTGGVNSPQLHFEIRSGKKALNPKAYLQ